MPRSRFGSCRQLLTLSVLTLVFVFAPAAFAFSIDSAVGDACHEMLSTDALAEARSSVPTAEPIPAATEDDLALLDDLPFSLASTSDLALAALIIGGRDNDLKGNGAQELDSLPSVHGDPDLQDEHCLRRPEHDDPRGSELALRDCREFIRAQFDAALEGLDEDGRPDPNHRTKVTVTLAIRGEIEVELPTFWLQMGRAMHAVQDGFTHTYRTSDGKRVIAVLNYIEIVNGTFDEASDGPAHSQELDRCDDPDALRKDRRLLATEASAALLIAALRPGDTKGDKREALDEMLTAYFSFEAGCDASNDWCNAPERAYGDDRGCACGVAGTGDGPSHGAVACAISLLWLVRRRMRSQPNRSRAGRWSRRRVELVGVALPVAFAVALATTTAGAEEGASPEDQEAGVDEEAAVDEGPIVGITGSIAASYDNPALAGAVAGNYWLDTDWQFGLAAEYNPFLSLNGEPVRRGVFNAYANVIKRWPMLFEPLSLRTSIHVGTSILAMDLVGAPAGSVGIYLGTTPLGLEWRVADELNVLLYPVSLALPVPQLSGVPFAYGQYRTTLGAELLF